MRAARRFWVRLVRLGQRVLDSWLLLLMVPALVLAATFGGWRLAQVEERETIHDMVDQQAARLKDLVEARLDLYEDTTLAIAERWRMRELATAEEWAFEVVTQSMVEPALESLHWITPELTWRWAGPATESPPGGSTESPTAESSTEPSDGAPPTDPLSQPSPDLPEFSAEVIDALDSSRQAMEPAVVGPLDVGGDPMVQVSVPVNRGGAFVGWVTGHYQVSGLARSVLAEFGAEFSVAFLHEGKELFERSSGGGELAREWGRERTLDRETVPLLVEVWPTAATLQRSRSASPQMILVGGPLLAVALTLLVGLIQMAVARSREVRLNERLQEEIRSRRHAEHALERRARELARSNREFEQFAYAISHDLKDPLNALAMNLQLAQDRNARPDDGLERPLGAARRSVERMNALLGGLLEYARAGSGGEPELVDADEALDEVLENLEESIARSGATVERGDLPRLVVHRTQLVRLLQNVVGNALKFRGEASPRIHVSAGRTGEGWHFQVRDNGVGLDPEEQKRIFDLFWRPGGSPDGSGVGLAVCKRIVEAQGGRIWVESVPGEGSTFHFVLGYEAGVS